MYPPHHSGGYEAVWQRSMRHAGELGHAVRIVVSDYRIAADLPEVDPDVHRSLRLYWDADRYEFPRLTGWQRLKMERHNMRVLRRHLEEFKPHVVTFWSMGCMSLSLIEEVRRRRLPAVFIVHDDWLAYGRMHDQWTRAWERNRWRRLLRPVVDRVGGVPTTVDIAGAGSFVFNSHYTLERAREVGINATQMEVLHPGIDERFYRPQPPGPWRWRVLCVGRIDRQKGVDTAVQAMAQLPPTATLSIWGSGDESYVADMKRLAERIHAADRIFFRGFASPDRLISAYEDADVVVFPVRWQEPFGLVPLEAMALGRPVVTTARGGTAEYVRHEENAIVIPVDDPSALARSVRRLAEDQMLRDRLRRGGQETAARYPAHRFAEDSVRKIVESVPVQARTTAAAVLAS